MKFKNLKYIYIPVIVLVLSLCSAFIYSSNKDDKLSDSGQQSTNSNQPKLANVSFNRIEWMDDYSKTIELAKEENKPVIVYFSALTNMKCRMMEYSVLNSPEVIRKLAKFVKVRLYTDRDKEPFISNKKLMTSTYGSIELPLYVILTPMGEIVGTKTFDKDTSAFEAFLDKGINSVKK